jgi:hypothetical protein
MARVGYVLSADYGWSNNLWHREEAVKLLYLETSHQCT